MKKFPILTVLLVAFFFSCSDQTTIYEDSYTDESLKVEKNEAILESSIIYDHAGVLDILNEATITGKSNVSAVSEPAGNYPLTLVAQVAPPSYATAQNLTASHVAIDGDNAYVSYNTVEDGYAGAIDIINVNDPTNPRVTARLYFTNADLNSVAYDDGYVYLVGGVDAEKSVTATDNSLIAKIAVSNGRFNLSLGVSFGFQEGYNATDVEVAGNTVIVTSGQGGVVRVYNKSDLSTVVEAPFPDLRSVAHNNSNIAVLDASQGITIMDEDLNKIRDIAITSDFGTNTKRALDYSGERIFVAEGANGTGVYNVTTGALEEYIPILMNSGIVDASDVVTNAVAINEELVLMANGGAGLCLSKDHVNQNADVVGILQLEGSINYVATKGDYVFAASGKEGLQIIKLNRPDESLVARCTGLSTYSGSVNLNVDANDNVAYKGAKRFTTFNVNGSLLLCGVWTVKEEVTIAANALFEMNGTLVVAKNNKRRDVTVGPGATFRVEGNLTIYGDLNLEDGATIEFIGDDAVVNIFGSVNKHANATVEGNFNDVKNKF